MVAVDLLEFADHRWIEPGDEATVVCDPDVRAGNHLDLDGTALHIALVGVVLDAVRAQVHKARELVGAVIGDQPRVRRAIVRQLQPVGHPGLNEERPGVELPHQRLATILGGHVDVIADFGEAQKLPVPAVLGQQDDVSGRRRDDIMP